MMCESSVRHDSRSPSDRSPTVSPKHKVSRVLNRRDPRAAQSWLRYPRTATKGAIEQLNYRPNLNARGLASNRSVLILIDLRPALATI